MTINYIESNELSNLLLEKQSFSHYVAILDVRDEDFDEKGHIPNAIHIASVDFEAQLPMFVPKLEQWLEIYPRVTVVLHCSYSQIRGPQCAMILQRYCKQNLSTLPEIRVLKGGYLNWVALYRYHSGLVTSGLSK
jgi:rhodanese-related sulfurtransferase